jgi:hypothetical protein
MWLSKMHQHTQIFLFQTPACALMYLGHLRMKTCMGISNLSPYTLYLSLERLAVITDTLHALEVLSSVDQSALVVLAGVDEVGIEEGKLN